MSINLELWQITYSYKDGGSTWYVRADSRESAKALVKLHFRQEHGWKGEGTFRGCVQDDSEGNVFKGGL
jgi:hypothetical protein